MNITATIIAEGITFFFFIWITMKFVWPPLMKAMQERQEKIADGLAAAERGTRDLELAQERAAELLKEAREQAAEVLNQANRRSAQILDEAKSDARAEGERLVAAARAQIDQEISRARETLREEVAKIAVSGASRILEREIDAKAHAEMLDQLAGQL
ncbi:MAG: F0F1 ATP synthase subunit B [Gammaproteobacteria bacterium]